MILVNNFSGWHLVLIVFGSLLLICEVSCLPAKKDVIHMKENVNVVEFDWRMNGVISPVSNQGSMGSPLDFVIAEEVESLYAIDMRRSVLLMSRQEIVDCCDDSSHQPKFKGFDCIVQIGGLCTMTAYQSKGGRCGNDTCTAVGKVGSTGYIPAGREDIMMKMILQVPLAVWIDASLASFQEYRSGVYSDPSCQTTRPDHTMQVVGYGTDGGQDYWILKNSWGVDWGENGYMRILRGKNTCGVANQAFFPINLE